MVLVEIATVVPGELAQTRQVVKRHPAIAEGEQLALAQLAQDAVDVDRGEPDGIGEQVLVQGTGEATLRAQAGELQAQPELDQEMRGADQGAASADVHQVLDHHRLVARGGPQERHAQPGLLLERSHQLPCRYLGHGDVGDRREAVVRGAQQDAAQADDVAGDREVDYLPPAVGQQFVGAGPPLLEDEGVVPDLPLVDQVGARGDRSAAAPRAGRAGSALPGPRADNGSTCERVRCQKRPCHCNSYELAIKNSDAGSMPIAHLKSSVLLWISLVACALFDIARFELDILRHRRALAPLSKDDIMDRNAGAAGLAALAICKSLLLSLSENKTLATGEVRSILADAAAANRNAIPLTPDGGKHEAAVAVIELILAGGNSVRFE